MADGRPFVDESGTLPAATLAAYSLRPGPGSPLAGSSDPGRDGGLGGGASGQLHGSVCDDLGTGRHSDRDVLGGQGATDLLLGADPGVDSDGLDSWDRYVRDNQPAGYPHGYAGRSDVVAGGIVLAHRLADVPVLGWFFVGPGSIRYWVARLAVFLVLGWLLPPVVYALLCWVYLLALARRFGLPALRHRVARRRDAVPRSGRRHRLSAPGGDPRHAVETVSPRG